MKTDPQTIRSFLAEAHACAIQMMENAAFIQKEIPSLKMPDALRVELGELCAKLIGTKHDLVHETFEIDELMATTPDAPQLWERMQSMREWIFDATMKFHHCVQMVEAAVKMGDADGSLSILLTESGTNILTNVPSAPDSEENAKTKAVSEQDEYDDDDEQGEDEYDANCYAFCSEDCYPVGQLIDAISLLTERPDLLAATSENLKVFLFAMERLPLVTPGVRMRLGLRLDQGGESDWIEIRMEDGEFTLGRGAWIDGDASTETVFEVGSGYRDGDAFVATQFAESFGECVADVCREVVIEDTSDEPFNGWDLEPDKSRWGSLPCSFF